MDEFNLLCFAKEYKDLIEVFYFIILMIGVVIAFVTLRANTEAQRALRSPGLFIFHPTNGDPIETLVIKNSGNIIATDINISVSENKLFPRLRLWLKIGKIELLQIPLLENEDEASIFIHGSELKKSSNIVVKVTYRSPFHNTKLKFTKSI